MARRGSPAQAVPQQPAPSRTRCPSPPETSAPPSPRGVWNPSGSRRARRRAGRRRRASPSSGGPVRPRIADSRPASVPELNRRIDPGRLAGAALSSRPASSGSPSTRIVPGRRAGASRAGVRPGSTSQPRMRRRSRRARPASIREIDALQESCARPPGDGLLRTSGGRCRLPRSRPGGSAAVAPPVCRAVRAGEG